MKFSKTLVSELNKIKLSVEDKAMADLMSIGWSEKDAYNFCFKPNLTYPIQYIEGLIRTQIERPEFIDYLRKKQKHIENVVKSASEQDEDIDSMVMGKDDVLREIVLTLKKMSASDPKRLDALKAYADLTQMKKEENEGEDETVHFYLPLRCSDCELYRKHNK